MANHLAPKSSIGLGRTSFVCATAAAAAAAAAAACQAIDLALMRRSLTRVTSYRCCLDLVRVCVYAAENILL